MDMCLHKFEIYQGTVAPKRGTQTLDTLVSPPPLPPTPSPPPQKKILSNPQFEIHLAQCNNVSTE